MREGVYLSLVDDKYEDKDRERTDNLQRGLLVDRTMTKRRFAFSFSSERL